MSLVLRESNAFLRDKRRIRRSGYDLAKLDIVVNALIHRLPLELRYRDHPLTGHWKGYRDCHIAPDWVLIYRVVGNELQLARTGSHSELL